MIYFLAIALYLLLLSCIGIYKSRQVKKESDFSVAGRSLSPWIMVCTMLAVWIGTGSILGNAEETYKSGMAAFILPTGTFIGMILLSLIATRARNIEASSVPEIIGRRFGQTARALAVVSLIVAYMVIVSYQFNAGGAVLEVVTGDKDPVAVKAEDVFTTRQIKKGYLRFRPDENWQGETAVSLTKNEPGKDAGKPVIYTIEVVPENTIIQAKKEALDKKNTIAVSENKAGKIVPKHAQDAELASPATYTVNTIPENGALQFVEPKLTAAKATLIAAIFITFYTMLAGLLSLAYADIVTGSIITLCMFITLPIYWFQAGGWDGMMTSFTVMGRPEHMELFGVYSWIEVINFCLPVFLLVLGDANQYQRIFASKNAKGAKSAVTTMIFVAFIIEIMIIACAWTAGSMTPDSENGRYILIFAAKEFLPLSLGCLFMVTAVGIIISTANSFLLVPATTFINDVYHNYINPRASERRTIFISRLMVLVFGIIAYLVSISFSESTGFFEKALYAFTIYGSSITPSIVAAIVWKKATRAGSISSILSGIVLTLLWEELIYKNEQLTSWLTWLPQWLPQLKAVLPAITLSVLCLVVVSLLTQPKQKKQEA